jgi:hypothetical protein
MLVELWDDTNGYDTYIGGVTVASDAKSYTFTKAALCALNTVTSASRAYYYVYLSVSSALYSCSSSLVTYCLDCDSTAISSSGS